MIIRHVSVCVCVRVYLCMYTGICPLSGFLEVDTWLIMRQVVQLLQLDTVV